jgi:hypothetical protein
MDVVVFVRVGVTMDAVGDAIEGAIIRVGMISFWLLFGILVVVL